MKLHLGCGEQYLEGYRNIDQPPSSHTVQAKSVADEHADLSALRYPAGSIDEVRLHHVFEHFPRPVAIALVASWASWIRPGGRLHVEVPDLVRTARSALSPFASPRRRLVGIRHLFGSHEAPWAVHWEGWTAKTLGGVLEVCGFEVEKVRKTHWKHTYNVHVLGLRTPAPVSRDALEPRVRTWLRDYTLDETEGEVRLLEVWMDAYRAQLERTWARPAGG